MAIKEILEDLKADLDRAKADLTDAKELISIGTEVGLPIAKFKADIRRLELEEKKYEKAIEGRLNGFKSKPESAIKKA